MAIETLCDIARNNALIFTEEEQDAIADAIANIQELQWYRKQNLISKEDVVIALWDTLPSSYHINCKEWLLFNDVEHRIRQIPKAEPSKENG